MSSVIEISQTLTCSSGKNNLTDINLQILVKTQKMFILQMSAKKHEMAKQNSYNE